MEGLLTFLVHRQSISGLRDCQQMKIYRAEAQTVASESMAPFSGTLMPCYFGKPFFSKYSSPYIPFK